MRNFDVNAQNNAIKKAAVDAVQAIFPIEGKLRKVDLVNVTLEDNLDPTDYSSQAKAKDREGTWGVPVYATLRLVDKSTGKAIDEDKIKVFTLPKTTSRFSYIVKGSEYQVTNQLRLKSGVYTTRKQNEQLKSQVNLSKGKNFDLELDEESGVISITRVGGGSANIPLYPILSYLGLSHQAIASALGAGIADANRSSDSSAVGKFAQALGLKSEDSLRDYLEGTEISKETTKAVFGRSHSNVSAGLLLDSAKNLISVQMGKREPDDRNSLEFKELHSIDDFIKERLEKNKQSLAFKVKRSLDNPNRTKLAQIVNPGAFSSTVESFFTQDDKSSTSEQTNPLEMLSGQYRATVMGSGGIQTEHEITDEMRNIHPSHFGFIDPIHTPESSRTGVNLHLPLGIHKDGKEIKKVVLKNGKRRAITPTEAYSSRIALPGQPETGKVKVMYKGKIEEVARNKVDFYTPGDQAMFSWSTNMIPFLETNQGNRSSMAAKMMEQAISLKHREAPLVQSSAYGTTFEKHIGEQLAVKAPEAGVVKKVAADHLVVRTKDGDKKINLYNNFALNRKSFLNHTPKVKVGDKVSAGQLLAESNYTDGGELALGINARVAYIPYKSLNYEDGIVITESAADRLTSEHMYKKTIELDKNTVLNLIAFQSMYPNVIGASNQMKLGDDGVVREGQKVEMGDVIIAALRRRDVNPELVRISKALSDRPQNISLVWGLEDAGVVQSVLRSGNRVTVTIKTEEKAKVGDKLAGRFGNKGVISAIIPDSEAPKNKDGVPAEILLNPHGVVSRINIGQIYESAAGKAALKSKTKIVNDNFDGSNNFKKIDKILKKHGVKDKEELFDSKTGESLGKVHVGNPYILKLFKQSQGNFSVRQGGPGNAYDVNRQPIKAGSNEGAQAMDQLTIYSMLSHGARANLREMMTTKGDSNDEYWKALKSGQMLPAPKEPFVYNKFMGYLKGAGIDVKKDGSKLALGPLTDDQVSEMSSGKIAKPDVYRGKDLAPIRGGLFDPKATGGLRGDKWSHIELTEPVVNPVFENAVKKLTGLGKKYDQIMAGKLHLDADGELNTDGRGVTGGVAMEAILKKINVTEQLDVLSKQAKRAKGDKLDDINKKMRYLKNLQDLKLSPNEAYLRKKLPVVPPTFRPLYPLPDGSIGSSDLNYMYQNTAVLNEMSKLPVMDLLPEDDKSDLRKDIYKNVKGVTGLTDLTIKGRERSGFISEIKGDQPKKGFFINKMLSKKQDYSGRGTIIPDAGLGLDEVGLPEEMAWKLFEPFVIRELGRHGKSPLDAIQEVKNKTELAKGALDIVMKERKILLNRAPSLHKFSIMAFQPKITDGKSIKIPPLVTKGLNADFDGDTMSAHVPISDEANAEATKLLPSNNLFQPGTGKLMTIPSQEAQIGLFKLSQTADGRAKLNKITGTKYPVDGVLTKKKTEELLSHMAQEMSPQEFAKAVSNLKAAGDEHAYKIGFSLGMDDIADLSKDRDKIVRAVKRHAKNPKAVDLSIKAADKLLDKKLANKNNALYDMVASGARGNKDQLRQILVSPLFVTDYKNQVIPNVINKSYSEGLDAGDYWQALYGARRGMMDRAVQTSIPGAFSKDIMASTIDNVISNEDCGVKKGKILPVTSPDIIGRYLANGQLGVARNTLMDSKAVSDLKKRGAVTIEVRTPLQCLQAKGTCAKCYGIDEFGKAPDIGDNVGAKAGQTISEPLVQLSMNSFHTGGVAKGDGKATGLTRINQLLKMPKIVTTAAPLAAIAGKVDKIEKGPAGGYYVHIGKEKHFVPKGADLRVKPGASVAVGDPLSTGVVKPQDLVKTKGMAAAQEYITDELHNAYASQGVKIDRKVFETVVRSLGNTTKVVNQPKGADFLPGDVVPYTVASNYNANLEQEVSVDESVGYELAKDYGNVKSGKTIDDKDAMMLKAMGEKTVLVRREALKHEPFLKGIESLPLLKKDWMAALGYRNLAKALTEGAGQGWKTDLEGYHPVPALVYGKNFGKGKDGKY